MRLKKANAEIIVNTYLKSFFNKKKCGLASARAGNVIGGGDWAYDRLIPDALISYESNLDLILRTPQSVRPWQHVLDCLLGFLLRFYREFYQFVLLAP